MENNERNFKQDTNKNMDIIHVFIVNQSSDNPWRTQGDYHKEQEEARERHIMIQKQHDIIIKSFAMNIVATVSALIAAASAIYAVFK